jgi:exopolysaccharide biosynthesis polyprenyl glycosylphosphotransferase
MNRDRRIKLTLVLTDIIAVYVTIALAYYTRVWLGGLLGLIDLTTGLSDYAFRWWIVVVIVLSILRNRGYGSMATMWDDLVSLSRGIFTAFLVVWVILSLMKEAATVSRVVVTLSFIYMIALVPAARFIAKSILFRTLGLRSPALLFEGTDPAYAERIRESLESEWYSGYEIVGEFHGTEATSDIDTYLVPIEYADEEMIKSLKPSMKNLIIVSQLPGLSFMSTDVTTFFGKDISLITTKNGLMSFYNKLAKRILDVITATLALVLLSPVLGLIAVLVKIDSRGPVIYRHLRYGQGLKEFYMLKFRTMHVDGDSILEDYLKKNPQAAVELEERNKIAEDPRVTRIGKWLRRLSLDELPQLVNVAKGDMSIVGPRPDAPDAIEKYLAEYREISNYVKPGITGLWQVSGRSEIKYAERVKLDYLYMLNWSNWLDFVIVLKTFAVIITGRGAY